MRDINDFPIYTVFDEPEIYNGKIVTGFYYIETFDHWLFHGNGWYSDKLVSYALEQGIELTIKYQ